MTDAVTLAPIDSLESAYDDWSRLARASRNVFLTPEWLSAWWEAFGAGRELVLRRCLRPDGSTAAILALCRDRQMLSAVRMLGHTQSDLLGPVCGPDDRGYAAEGLRTLLGEVDADLFVGGSLPVAEDWAGALGGRVLDRTASPTLTFDGRGWEDLLAERSSNFRGQMRRLERRLARDHEIRWRLATAATLDADVESLIRLHEARWGDRSGSFRGSWRDHQLRFIPVALDRGWLRLTVLEIDGTPAAAVYNLRFEGIESFYQAGRDPRFESLRLGLALQAHAIRSAAESGMSEYRFLRGAEAYKQRFADRDDSVETVGVALGPRGRLALEALRWAPSLPFRVGRRLNQLAD